MPLLASVRNRASAEVGNFRRRLTGYPARSAARTSPGTPQGVTDWRMRDLMLSGAAYLPSSRNGALMHVLRQLGKPCGVDAEAKYPITGYFNPVGQIVSFYDHALAGQWGRDLLPVLPDSEAEDAKAKESKPVPARTRAALDKLWQWSNLETERRRFTELAANHGTVGIRVSYQPPEEDTDTGRVFLSADPAERIVAAEEDARGNCISVVLEYTAWYAENVGDDEREVEVREEISRDRQYFQAGKYEVEYPNPLGVCPYVILRHAPDPQGFFGRHAYFGSEQRIHGINWGLSQLDRSVNRHIFPMWWFAAAGTKPEQITLSELIAVYQRLDLNSPRPDAKAIVPDVKLAEALAVIQSNAAFLRDTQPEMALSDLKLLGGLSGESYQQVLKAAEAACLRARGRYEDAFVRSLQIGMSVGILYGIWELGTGTGSKEAADKAYGDGQGPEAFRFKERPALPQTPAARLSEAQARQLEIQAEAAEQRQQVLRDEPKLVADMVKGQAEQAKLAGEFAGARE